MTAPRKGDYCPWVGCGHLDPQPPYRYKKDGIPSVTQLSSLIDMGKSAAFGYAASQITARVAMHNPHRLDGLETADCGDDKDHLCAACRFLRQEHAEVWRRKADLGTHVHHLACSWASGETVDADAITAPYLDAIALFYMDLHPQWLMTERTVEHDVPGAEYRGKFDGIVDLVCPSCTGRYGKLCRWLVDYKTSDRLYAAEQSLQLSAYRYSTSITEWKDGVVVDRTDVPDVDHCGVILLSDEGTYRLVELPATESAHLTVLRLRKAWEWRKEMEQWEREYKKQQKEMQSA